MVDLKRSALASALPLIIAISPPVWSDEQAAVAQDSSCSAGAAADAQRCRSPARPDGTPATTPPPDPAKKTQFPPSPIDSARPSLPPLTPSSPTPGADALTDLPRQAPAPSSPLLPPAQKPGAAAARRTGPVDDAEVRRQDSKLHQDLTWDYCGPKPGVTQVSPGLPAAENLPIDIVADRVDYDQGADVIQLQGGVEFIQDDRRLEADASSYDRRSGEVKASGDIYLEYPGVRLTGASTQYNLEGKQGTIEQPRYRISGNANLRGNAEQAWMLSEQKSRYRNILYTTCAPGRSDWSILASDMDLDQAAGIGTARNARIRIGDIPVLYTPYLWFPIDGRRRSGFLIPTFGSSDETGTDISLPYYWNIAPDMDATLTPRYMSMRGLMLGAQFRHLSRFQEFEIDGEILPRDSKAPEEGTRGALRIKQSGHLGAGWSTSVDYAAVSDDTYLQDFGNRLDVTSVRNLSQQADLNYAGDGWQMLTRVRQFQTVDTSIAPANRPYGQLPHIELNIDPRAWGGLVEYDLEAEYDYFDHNSAVHGSRLVAVPTVRLPLRRGFGYLIPRASLYSTNYQLIDQTEGLSAQPSHLVPSLDLDGKLIFERESDWFGDAVLQTLEPRLYYVLTPYEDQSDTPRFDTTALDFSFASLFRPNRFTGYDRIGDANRLTLGLTSRTIANQSGQELFRASIGQVYYFEDRRVQLTGDAIDTDISSSVAGELSAQLHEDLSALASLQWNPNQTEQPWEKQVVQIRYAPDSQHLLNLAYRFNHGQDESEEYEDTDLSFRMPLGSEVNVVGRWLYSMLNDETVEAFAGIEFGRCCWRVRLLGQHLKRSAESAGSTSIMLQLELAGLGSFGNQIDKLLERGIYGYESD